MSKNLISAIILVGGNTDSQLLEKSSDSVAWTNETIKVATDKLKGSFSGWRNYGAKEAKSEWLLYVDSDEEVTSSLRDEIIQYTNNPIYKHNAYAIPRRNFIFGKEFKHCGQWPDYQKRLFKKDAFKKWTGELHEEPNFEGELGHLKNPLIHIKHEKISEMMDKTNERSEIEAKLMLEANHPPMNLVRFTTAVLREFWLRMIKQMAFLDGGEGIIYALYQVFSRFVSYAKLWEMQMKSSK